MYQTTTIIFMNEQWDVEYRYYKGTNYPITSQSLEPNDPEELEISEFSHHALELSQDFCDEFSAQNLEKIEELIMEYIKG